MPPVPPNTVRTNIVWALGTQEIAVNTLHFVHVHRPTNDLDWAGDMTQRYADLVRDAFKSQWTNLGSFFPSGVTIQRVDAYHLDAASGHTIEKRTSVATGTTAMDGAAAGQLLPWQTATAVSLYAYDPATFDAQGKWKRGRIYLPCMSAAQTAGGRFSGAAGLAGYMKSVVDYMQGRPMDGRTITADNRELARLVVLSRRNTVSYPVTHVRVDDLFDVQKRRQNNLVPAVTIRAVTPQNSVGVSDPVPS